MLVGLVALGLGLWLWAIVLGPIARSWYLTYEAWQARRHHANVADSPGTDSSRKPSTRSQPSTRRRAQSAVQRHWEASGYHVDLVNRETGEVFQASDD